MPRVRKITPDGRSTILVTIDQMPGARRPNARTSTSFSVFSIEFFELFLRSVLQII
jgi:hypothetical protein